MAQDDYYYEIQLTNKQLVFYFMAGATVLIVVFLGGVLVGRGVDSNAEAGGPRAVQEERLPAEEPPKVETPAPDLNYARRLEGERREESLERPAETGPAATATPPATPVPLRPTSAPGAAPTPAPAEVRASAPPVGPAVRPTPTPKPPRARPSPEPRASAEPRATPSPGAPAQAAAGTFTLQVGAFKDRKAAETVAARLKGRGFPAYVVSPDGAPNGLFNVRVGPYAARPDAERVQARLRDQERYKPFIVKN